MVSPAEANSLYRKHINPALIARGIDPAAIRSHSIPVPTGTKTNVHLYAIGPEKPDRLLIFVPGAKETAVTLRNALADLFKMNVGVLVYETYGMGVAASALTYLQPETRSIAAITEGLNVVKRYGVMQALEAQDSWKGLPIHLLGSSFGGGTVTDHMTSDNFGCSLGVTVGPDRTTRIKSVALMAPRNGLGKNYYPHILRYASAFLRFSLWITRGRIEKYLKIRTPESSELKDNPSAHPWYQELQGQGLRPSYFPLVYSTMIEHDRKVAQRIRNREGVSPCVKPDLPILWGIYPRDKEVDPYLTAELALLIGGNESFVMPIKRHNPFRGTEASVFTGILMKFWEQSETSRPIQLPGSVVPAAQVMQIFGSGPREP